MSFGEPVELLDAPLLPRAVGPEIMKPSKQRRLSLMHTTTVRPVHGMEVLASGLYLNDLKNVEAVLDEAGDAPLPREDVRHMHGFLLLELNYVCQAVKESNNHNHNTTATTSSCFRVLNNLRKLYQSPKPPLFGVLTRDECMETISFLCNNCFARKHVVNERETSIILFILEKLVHSLINEPLPVRECKRMILHLVEVFGAVGAMPQQQTTILQVLNFLQSQSSIDDVSMFSRLALHSLNLPQVPTRVNLLDHQLFHWECLAHSKTGAYSLQEDPSILQQLFKISVDDDAQSLSLQAVTTLSLIAANGRFTDALLEHLVDILIRTDCTVRLGAIHGLRSLTRRNRKITKLFVLHADDVQRVVSVLTEIVLTKPDQRCVGDETLEEAAAILLDILTTLATTMGHNTVSIPRSDAILIGQVLLRNEDEGILGMTVAMLANTLRHDATTLQEFPGILTSLATALLAWNKGPSVVANQILNVFREVASLDATYQKLLASQPRVLESLVPLTTSRFSMSTRETAVSILLEIAKEPSNRCFLARQVGLLAGMIRYVREWNVNDPSRSIQERESIKDAIERIAKAL